MSPDAGAPNRRRVLGLSSGTSADGVDVALVDLYHPPGDECPRVELLGATTVPYAGAERVAVLGAAGSDAYALARLHRRLGEVFADAAVDLLGELAVSPTTVDLVGCHGQTVAHEDERGRPAATLQLGEPAYLAARLGVPVIHDFRQADVAVGGTGAPLVPLLDWLLLRPRRGLRLAQNLGGLGNLTVVTPRLEDVRAFDTGPANAPLDAAARLLPGSPRRDERGRGAARGTVDADVVRRLLEDPRLRRPPPRSFDRDQFGAQLVLRVREWRPRIGPENLLATLTEYVAASIALALERFVPRRHEARELLVSGGGVHNAELLRRLEARLDGPTVRSTAELGVDADAKEAVLFAVLADRHVRGLPGNLPAVTGAERPVVLGKLQPGLRRAPPAAG